MGCPESVIPEPFLRNNHVNCFILDQNTKQPYDDILCLFRALLVHSHGTINLETSTSKFCNIFVILDSAFLERVRIVLQNSRYEIDLLKLIDCLLMVMDL